MQIEYYQEFLTLSITKNFSEAAIQLNVSQPTLSRHIDILEKEFRCKLLTRTRPVTLTPNGQKILPYIVATIRAHDELLDRVKSIRKTTSEEIKIQDLSFAPKAHNLLSQYEHSTQTKYPETVFRHIDPRTGKNLIEQIEEGYLDIAFAQGFGATGQIFAPKMNENILVSEIPSLRGSMCFIGRCDNPLLDLGRSPVLSDFKAATFLSPALRYLDVFRTEFSRLCETFGGFSPRFDYRETDCHSNFYAQDPGESLYILVASQDDDHATLPPWLAQETCEIVFPEYECATYSLTLQNAQNPGAKALVKILNDQG